MKPDAIIFDIDGTLWNACGATAIGWSAGLASLGIDKKVSYREIERVAGNTIEVAVDILFSGLRAQHPELTETLAKYEADEIQTRGGIFYPHSIRGIKELAKNYKIFLVSNCPEWYLRAFLERSGLRQILTDFDCHGLSGMPKDEMLARLSFRHCLENPVYIGDTAMDKEAASLAGMGFIQVSYGFGLVEDRLNSFDSFASLLEYLLERK